MAESTEAPGKYFDENYKLKRDYAEHERLMRQRGEMPYEREYEHRRFRDPSSKGPYVPSYDRHKVVYRTRTNYKPDDGTGFSPKRLYSKDLVNDPVVRKRDFSKDYFFLQKMYARDLGFDQNMIGVRNVKATARFNSVGKYLSSSFDTLSSPILSDSRIRLDFLGSRSSDGKYVDKSTYSMGRESIDMTKRITIRDY